ncbi:MAG: insulinase family protein [Chloracidobacterium sp.]|nr:insulinase family protein [Chloracidobacterium sp.]
MKMTLLITLCVLCASVVNVPAQDTPPPPSTPRSAVIPKIHEKRLANGLTVAVVERKGVPLVSVELMVDTGITYETIATSGLTRMSMNLLTRGTKSRTASQISNEIEFIGERSTRELGSIGRTSVSRSPPTRYQRDLR